MGFIDYIVEVMEKRDITVYKLCKDIGMSQQTFYNWKDGSKPALDKAIKIIIYLGLSADEIFGIKTPSDLTTQEQELIRYYRQLPAAEQERELGRLEGKAEIYQDEKKLSS